MKKSCDNMNALGFLMVLREVMKKCRYLWVILIVFGLILFNGNNYSYARGKFVELNFKQEDNNQPVALNEEEVFFAGGWNGLNTNKINSAKKYNIKSKKIIPLNSTMNFPRINYGAIKYDDNHILVLGGYCIGKNHSAFKDCSKIAEIYDIRANKFTRISDSNLSFPSSVRTILLKNGKVFVLSGTQMEIFDPKSNKFLQVKPKGDFLPSRNEYMYTIYPYIAPDAISLNDNEILIFGTTPINFGEERTFKMEILNILTGKSVNVPVEYSVDKIYYKKIGTPIKINENTILFIGTGKDRRSVLRFDIKERKFYFWKKLGKALSGTGCLLDNGNILLIRGVIEDPDYFRGTSLERVIYDYKNNKIYNRKLTHESYYVTYFIKFKKLIYISGYSEQKPMIYKY